MQKTKEEVRSRITAIEAEISSYHAQIRAAEIKKNNIIYKQKISPPLEAERLQQQIYLLDDKIAELNSKIDQDKKVINRLFTELTALTKPAA